VAGTVAMLDAANQPLRFIGESTANFTNVSWSGFADSCSGMREYVLSIEQSADGTSLYTSPAYESGTSHAALPSEVLHSLPEGVALSMVVTGISHVGMSVRASAGFSMDRTPPVSRGSAFNADMRNVACQSAASPFRTSWDEVEDPESGVVSIEWALGYWPQAEDLQPFTRVDGDYGSVLREWSPYRGRVLLDTIVYSTLRVRNGAGDTTLITPPPVRVVPSNCTASFVCLVPQAPLGPSSLPLVATRPE